MKKKNNIVNFQEAKEQIEFKKYGKNLSVTERNKIIEEHMPILNRIARKISFRLPKYVEKDDLVSAGVLGLMDAIEKYDVKRKIKFKTYAEFRIRGAMMDSLRSQDWIPRSIREKAKTLKRVVKQLELKFFRQPTDKEVADAMSLTMKEYRDLLTETCNVNVVSIEEQTLSISDKSSIMKIITENHTALSDLNLKGIHGHVRKIIDTLSEREKAVLNLYYDKGYNLRMIGQALQITESRVSQLHARALEVLKDELNKQFNIEDVAA